MGLIKELVLLPIAPVRGTLWVAERLADEVEREHGASAIQKLDEIEVAKQRGEIDEREAAELQEEIIERQVVQS